MVRPNTRTAPKSSPTRRLSLKPAPTTPLIEYSSAGNNRCECRQADRPPEESSCSPGVCPPRQTGHRRRHRSSTAQPEQHRRSCFPSRADGGEGCDEHDLKQRCTDHHVRRYAQQIVAGTMMNPPPTPMMAPSKPTTIPIAMGGMARCRASTGGSILGILCIRCAVGRSTWLAATGLVHRVDAFHQHQPPMTPRNMT